MEVVLQKASNATFWVGTGQYETQSQLQQSLPSFKDFEAVKRKNLFTSSSKKGATGGILFYELASMRPDLVLEDLIRILHPNLLAPGNLHFYEALP
jgi:iron complex transport system substrate-binding protein